MNVHDGVAECWISHGLSPRTKDKAAAELQETADGRLAALAELRHAATEYHEQHPDIVFARTDDAFLTRFLRARKYDVGRSLMLLVGYTKFRGQHPELFEGVTLDHVQPVLESKLPFVNVMRERDEEGRRVLVFHPARLDPASSSAMDAQAAFVYILDALIEDEETQVNGFVVVEDYTGMTLSKMLMFDQKLIKQAIDLVQDAFPARFKGFHFLHQPWYFSLAWSVAKPFMKEKIRNRIHLHGSDLESLYRQISKHSLPSEVGGEQSQYDPSELIDLLRKIKVERPPKSTLPMP